MIFTLAIAVGSVNIPPGDILRVFAYQIFGIGETPAHTQMTIIWNLRLPRALLAFIVGAAISVSGAVMQSVLRNPLASSFTLGVSSGASLGAGLVLFGIPLVVPLVAPLVGADFFNTTVFVNFSLPVMGFAFGMGTMVLAVFFASRMDGGLSNNTIILVGMVLSLFINSITTLLMTVNRESMQRLVLWQMGSFSSRGWLPVMILTPFVVVGVVLILFYHQEMDIMTFGEEQALVMGVNLKHVKWILLLIAAALTGSAISFVGIIGFVDLVAPHIVRRIFGARHVLVIPLSALFGGAFMMICDIAARSVPATGELPVGVVSALIGAPFFAYIYFSKGRPAHA